MRRKYATTSISLPNIFFQTVTTLTNRFEGINLPSSFRNFRRSNILFPLNRYIGIFVVILLVILSFYLGGRFARSSITYQDGRPAPAVAKAKQILNKELAVPLKDSDGKEVTKIKYVIETVELQDSIIVKGQRANAVKGRTFLLLNLKITNDYSQGVEINSKDYIRLSVNGKIELLAADIHNDPVKIQAISTKYTRIGFPINDSDKNLMLKVGEIKGQKETVKLNLKKV